MLWFLYATGVEGVRDCSRSRGELNSELGIGVIQARDALFQSDALSKHAPPHELQAWGGAFFLSGTSETSSTAQPQGLWFQILLCALCSFRR
jgi:hypothetical protein